MDQQINAPFRKERAGVCFKSFPLIIGEQGTQRQSMESATCSIDKEFIRG